MISRFISFCSIDFMKFPEIAPDYGLLRLDNIRADRQF